MNQRHRDALAAVQAAAAALTEAHWRADALVHVARVDAATAARRLGVARPLLLEMLAAVQTVRELGDDADLCREKSSVSGIIGSNGIGVGVRAATTVTKARAEVQPDDRERLIDLATAGMRPAAISIRLGIERRRVAAELQRAQAAGLPIPRFVTNRKPAAGSRGHSHLMRA